MISKFILIPLALFLVVGYFTSIVTGNGFAAADPFKNKVKIITDSKYKNDCDEYDTGTNNAFCSDIDTTTTDSINIDGKNNKVTSDIHVNQIQKYDERNGNNNVVCENKLKTQVNTLSLNGDNTIDVDINTKQSNDCDNKSNTD